MKYFRKILFLLLFLILPLILNANEIKIGMLFDMSGPTKDVSIPFAQGMMDYFQLVNKSGGISGKNIKAVLKDTKYSADVAIKEYDLMKNDGIKLIHGWGTGECLALQPKVNADKIVFFTASYDDKLGDAVKASYNFFVGASYSTQSRVLLNFIKEDFKGKGQPVVAILRNSTSFGKSPFDDNFYADAKKMNIKIIEEIIELNAKEADAQIKSIAEQKADYALIQQTLGATIAILKSAKTQNYTGKLIGLNWAINEALVPVLRQDCEGYLGLPLFAQWEEKSQGMDELQKFLLDKTGSAMKRPSKYIAGWVSAMALVEGLKKTKDTDSSESIKSGFETISNFNAGGLSTAISFSAKEHRGQTGVKIYVIKNGRLEPYSNKIYSLK